MEAAFTDIRCNSCGAPARFDIVHQEYRCSYCGGIVGLSDAVSDLDNSLSRYTETLRNSDSCRGLAGALCSGCGAEIVFRENEPLSECAFCGRSLVRKAYAAGRDLPRGIIPFGVTRSEAETLIGEWCRENSSRQEAALLGPVASRIQGFYLPYDLVKGPVHMKVSAPDTTRQYDCEGFLEEGFVNKSADLDNLLLDGMEPFDGAGLEDFDFGYVAGQCIKLADVLPYDAELRAAEETAEIYRPFAADTLVTKAVTVEADVGDTVSIPVLLPVYYVSKNGITAAVNGQTGKVSVKALADKEYLTVPWWFKTLLVALLFFGVPALVMLLLGKGDPRSLAPLTVVNCFLAAFGFVLFISRGDAGNRFLRVRIREILTSGGRSFTRSGGKLVLSDRILRRKAREPLFFEQIDGRRTPVMLRFVTPMKLFWMTVGAALVLLSPIIIALFINGFDVDRLAIPAAIPWFTLMGPLLPILLMKFGIRDARSNPAVYIIRENAGLQRYRAGGGPKEFFKRLIFVLLFPPTYLAIALSVLVFLLLIQIIAFGGGN